MRVARDIIIITFPVRETLCKLRETDDNVYNLRVTVMTTTTVCICTHKQSGGNCAEFYMRKLQKTPSTTVVAKRYARTSRVKQHGELVGLFREFSDVSFRGAFRVLHGTSWPMTFAAATETLISGRDLGRFVFMFFRTTVDRTNGSSGLWICRFYSTRRARQPHDTRSRWFDGNRPVEKKYVTCVYSLLLLFFFFQTATRKKNNRPTTSVFGT